MIRIVARALRWLAYQDGEKRYIIAPVGIKVGDTIDIRSGCRNSAGQCVADPYDPIGYRSRII